MPPNGRDAHEPPDDRHLFVCEIGDGFPELAAEVLVELVPTVLEFVFSMFFGS